VPRGGYIRLVALVAGLGWLGAPAAATCTARLATRGPSAPLVGAVFVVSGPPAALVGALRGGSVRLPLCRFGHGVAMLAAGAAVLPAGLLLAPIYHHELPDAWLDGLVDAFQEDYCTRPFGSVLP
jgi:hypothetical protein